jgi:hypothetical protein
VEFQIDGTNLKVNSVTVHVKTEMPTCEKLGEMYLHALASVV